MQTAQVYKSLIATGSIMGVPFAYMAFLLSTVLMVYMLVGMQISYPLVVFILGHVIGFAMTLHDPHWWHVVTVSLRRFGVLFIRKVRYVV